MRRLSTFTGKKGLDLAISHFLTFDIINFLKFLTFLTF